MIAEAEISAVAGLSTRASRLLKSQNIMRVADLRKTTITQLLSGRRAGVVSVSEILRVATGLGIKLRLLPRGTSLHPYGVTPQLVRETCLRAGLKVPLIPDTTVVCPTCRGRGRVSPETKRYLGQLKDVAR